MVIVLPLMVTEALAAGLGICLWPPMRRWPGMDWAGRVAAKARTQRQTKSRFMGSFLLQVRAYFAETCRSDDCRTPEPRSESRCEKQTESGSAVDGVSLRRFSRLLSLNGRQPPEARGTVELL